MGFRKEFNSKRLLKRYEARLVACGFTQKEGIDYFNVYSSVLKYTTVRLFVAFDTRKGWHAITLGVKNAFLNATITDE